MSSRSLNYRRIGVSHISGTWMTTDSLVKAALRTQEALRTGREICCASIHLVGRFLNSTSDRYVLCASELVHELGVSEVAMVVDLQILVDLGALALDSILMLRIGELLIHLGAGIWDVAGEDDLIVVYAILLKLKIVDEPSAFILWDSGLECLEIVNAIT